MDYRLVAAKRNYTQNSSLSGRKIMAVFLTLFSVLVFGISGCSHHDRVDYIYNPGTVLGFSVTPDAASLTPGMSVQIHALASFRNNIHENVTEQAEWTVSDESIAVVDSGLVTAVSPGSVTVTAAFGDFRASSEIQVVNSVPSGYTVVSSQGVVDGELAVIDGLDEQLHVYANLEDGSSIDITETIIWESSDPDVAYMSEDGKLCTEAPGQAVIIGKTADGEVVTQFTVDVAEAKLTSIVLDKTVLSLAAGYSDSLTATAGFDNGKSRKIDAEAEWSSSDDSIVSVSLEDGKDGTLVKIVGLKEGTAVVTAAYQGQSAECRVDVSAAELIGLTFDQGRKMQLPKGLSAEVSVTGSFSDGSSRDVTQDVSVSSDNVNVVNVAVDADSTCLYAVDTGKAVISALGNGITAELSVTVSDAVVSDLTVEGEDTVIAGKNIELTALAEFSDGTSDVDVTADASWTSSDTEIAMVTNGVVRSLKAGTVTVTAKIGDAEASKEITVSEAVVVSFTLEGDNTVIAGRSITLTALANFSDGTVDVEVSPDSWTSGDTEIAAVDSNGEVKGLKAGTVTVTAKIGAVEASKEITVGPAVVTSLTIEGEDTAAAGESIELNAYAEYSDGTAEVNVTPLASWTSGDTETAMVTDGVVRTLKAGTVTVTAKIDGIEASKEITVSDAVISSLQLIADSRLAIGKTLTVKAVVGYSDGTDSFDEDMDSWTSSVPEIAAVSTDGEVTGLLAGTVTITAKIGDIKVSKEIEVFSDVSTFAIESDNTTVNSGETLNLRAVFYYQDGTQRNVTNDAVWSPAESDIADVSAGELTGKKPGTVTVAAKYQGITAELEIEVTPLEISLEPLALYQNGKWVVNPDCFLYKLGYYDSINSLELLHYQVKKGNSLVNEMEIPSEIEKDGVTYKVTAIGPGAFKSSNLTKVTIPDSVVKIDIFAFYQSSLTEVTIPDSVTSIGDFAFTYSRRISKIVIGSGLTELGREIFKADNNANADGVTTGTEIEIKGESLTVIGYQALYGCRMTTLTLPESLTLLDEDCMSGCGNLTTVNIPKGVVEIKKNALYNCKKIKNLVVPDSVTAIGSNAFKNIQHIKYNGSASGSPWGAQSIN